MHERATTILVLAKLHFGPVMIQTGSESRLRCPTGGDGHDGVDRRA